MYIGQNDRSFQIRITEHKKAIETKMRKSGFSNHCIKKCHKTLYNFKMFHTCNKVN